MAQALEVRIGRNPRTIAVSDLVIAGWTGRDRTAVERHIAELAAIGVRRPSHVPCFYRVGANLLTTAEEIEVSGGDSSGEVEFVLFALPDGLHVGVGSDHTDRRVEAYSVTVSKQICPKPVGVELWPFAEVAEHWDELELRSWVTCDGARRLYQDGKASAMLAPQDLIARAAGGASLSAGTAMFCGTLPVKGAIGGGERFEAELYDPVRRRSLRLVYRVRVLATTE